MRGFSLRTLMLLTAGMAMVCGVFTVGGVPAVAVHLMLVLAFAIPGGSLGYDLARSSRGVAVGTCVGAVTGTLAISTIVLCFDFCRLW